MRSKKFTMGDTAALVVATNRMMDKEKAKIKTMSKEEKQRILREMFHKATVNKRQKRAEDALFKLVTSSKGWGKRPKSKTKRKKPARNKTKRKNSKNVSRKKHLNMRHNTRKTRRR